MSYSESSSPQIKLVLTWDEGFNTKNVDTLAKYLDKDFSHITYPRSLGRPEKNKEEFVGDFSKIIALWTKTNKTIHSIEEVPGKVIYHFTNNTKTVFGLETTYEAVVTAHIVTDEGGSLKIKKIEEFVDSKTLIETIKAYEAAGVGQKK